MKTVLLLIFTLHQMFLISSALKCYECSGDCKSPKEKECEGDVKCCYSSTKAFGAGAGGGESTVAATAATEAPAAARMKRNVHNAVEFTRSVLYTEFLDDASGSAAAGGGGGGGHTHKGCCTKDVTKEVCKGDADCYMCEKDLCNKGNTSSASAVLGSIFNILLSLAIIALVFGSPKKLID